MRLEVLRFHKSERAWMHSLANITMPKSNIIHQPHLLAGQCRSHIWHKSRSSHEYYRIPLQKAYHTPITCLKFIAHESQVSHMSHHTVRRPAPSHSPCPEILGPVLGKVVMLKLSMEEPCVGRRHGCHQHCGTFRKIRSPRVLLRPTKL